MYRSNRFRCAPAAMLLAGSLALVGCQDDLAGPSAGPAPDVAPSFDTHGASALQYTISWQQDGETVTVPVTAIETSQTVEEFYAFTSPPGAARTGYEVEDAATLLFHRDANTQRVSLVVIYDAGGETDNPRRTSTVRLDPFMSIDSFPVLDDPKEWPTINRVGIVSIRHAWGDCCTDGFAARAAFEKPFSMELRFENEGGVEAFQWVQSDGTRVDIPVDPTRTTIRIVAEERIEAPTETADPTPPEVTAIVSGTLGNDDWYVDDVMVTWTVNDDESDGVSQTGCDPRVVDEDTDGLTLTCEATSAGGTTRESVTVKRDATPPSVTLSTDAARYGLADPVVVACTAEDATSGVTDHTCPESGVPAWRYGIGTTTLEAWAVDRAGHSHSATASFRVLSTVAGIAALVRAWVDHPGVANALCRKLGDADAAAGRGQANARRGQLGAFVNQVDDLRGKWLSDEEADRLIQFVTALMNDGLAATPPGQGPTAVADPPGVRRRRSLKP